MLAVEVTEFDLGVARHRRERAACAAGAIPLSRPQTHTATAAASEPAGDVTPAALAHLEVLRVIAAAFDRLRGMTVPQAAPASASAVVPMPVPARPRLPTAQQSPKSSPHRGRIQPTLLHLFEDWKRKQSRPRTTGAVQNAVLEFHELHGSLPVEGINRQRTRLPRRAHRTQAVRRQALQNR